MRTGMIFLTYTDYTEAVRKDEYNRNTTVFI